MPSVPSSETIPWDPKGNEQPNPPTLLPPRRTPAPPPAPPLAPPPPRPTFGYRRGRVAPPPGQSLDLPPRPSVPRGSDRRCEPSPKSDPSHQPQTPPRGEPPPLPTHSLERLPPRRLQSQSPPPRRLDRLRRPPVCPGNVYGEERHPTKIE